MNRKTELLAGLAAAMALDCASCAHYYFHPAALLFAYVEQVHGTHSALPDKK